MFALKLGLLSFWDLWFFVVFLTNLFEGFRILSIFPVTWKFASKNFEPVAKAVAMYCTSPWLPKLLFYSLIVWQFITVVMFAWAFTTSLSEGTIKGPEVNAAFTCGLGLWAAFMIADEVFKEYDTQRSHVLFFIAQLFSLLVVHAFPP